jgi:hypothetical protein
VSFFSKTPTTTRVQIRIGILLTAPTQPLQRHLPPLGPPDPLHNDEVRLVRDDRRDDVPAPAGPESGLLDGRADRSRLLRWIPGGNPVRDRLSPGGRDGVETQLGAQTGRRLGRGDWEDLQGHWVLGAVEWVTCSVSCCFSPGSLSGVSSAPANPNGEVK